VIGYVLALILVSAPGSGDVVAQDPAKLPQQQAQPPAKEKKPKKDKKPKPSPDLSDDAADEPDPQVVLPPPPPAHPEGFEWEQHPGIRFGKHFNIEFEAKLQEDWHQSYVGAEQSAGLEDWELHRNRFGVLGNIGKHIEFEVEHEFTEHELSEKDVEAGLTPKSQWKDVRANFDYVKNAQIQIGKFKVPFGLDQTTGVTHNDFVYRSLGAIYLSPGRDIGAMVHGRFFKRGLNYWAGVFEHDGDNAKSKKIQGGDATVAGRVTFRPLRSISSAFDLMEFGVNAAVTSLSDDNFRPNGLRGRTVMTQDTFYEPVYVKGRRTRSGGDLDWTIGPASVRAEYDQVLDTRDGQGIDNSNLPDARYRSWFVSGTFLVTGEPKVRPVRANNDFITGGGIGAIEVAARVERLYFDSVDTTGPVFATPRTVNIQPSGDKLFTIGVNWTLNRFLKIQFDVIHEQVEGTYRNPIPDGSAFWNKALRLQIVL